LGHQTYPLCSVDQLADLQSRRPHRSLSSSYSRVSLTYSPSATTQSNLSDRPLSTSQAVSIAPDLTGNHSHIRCAATAPPRPNNLNFNPPTSIKRLAASSSTDRLCTSYSPVLNFSNTLTSSINPQTVKTGTGKVIAPEIRWGNWESGKWMEELFKALTSAARPAEEGMERSWVRVAGGIKGEYRRR